MRFSTAQLFETDRDPYCHFGISESIALGIAAGATEAGVGAATAGVVGDIGAGALIGAGGNAALSGLTGGDPLKGALSGAITGGAIGLGPALGAATGLGTTAADIGLGTAGGAVGSLVTGGSPIQGALGGGIAGFGAAALGGTGASGSSTSPTATTVGSSAAGAGGSGGGSAVAQAGAGAPSPVGGANPVDLTSSPTSSFGLTDPNGNAFASPSSASLGDWSARPAGTTGTGGVGDISSKLMGFIEKNPNVLLAGGLLGANMLMGDKATPAEQAIQKQAGEAQTQSATLEAYQQSGTLPPGLQSVVDQQIDAAKSQVVSEYSKLGLSNSTMMVDKLNQLKVQKSAEIAQFADQLAKQGIQWANLSAQEFGQLLTAQTAQDEAFTKALSSFAGGLAGLRSGGSSTSS